MKFSDASFAVKKGFPFLPFLNMEITKMRRSGLLYHILERILFKKPFCPSKHNDDDEAPFKIQKAVLPFSIIVLGFISSLIFLAIELINYIHNSKAGMTQKAVISVKSIKIDSKIMK